MSRIETTLRAAKASRGCGLIPFITAGDPDPSETPGLVAALAEAGADVVELGIPHSDPVADGAAIQRSSERALARGVSLETVLGIVRRTRDLTPVPIVLFGYLNSILAFGVTRFALEGSAAGVDGLLLTDLPVEEGSDLRAIVRASGIDTIQLVAPTSGRDRLPGIVAQTRGFVYCISRTGVTGRRDDLPGDLGGLVASVRAVTDLPVAVGFGISRADQARAVARIADAIVVGSALVEAIWAAPAGGREEAARGFLSALSPR